MDVLARDAHAVTWAADDYDGIRTAFPLHPRIHLGRRFDAVDFVARNKARAGKYDRLQQVDAGADGADTGEIRPHVAALRHQSVTARATGLPAEKNLAATIDVTALQ